MGTDPNIRAKRPDGALLAGVCAGIAGALRWNVWVLRVLFVGFLALKTVAALIIYALLALAMHLLGDEKKAGNKSRGKKTAEGLVSPEFAHRNERIADLERRFRDLEESGS
jgi:phage shock protein PspC (stress-responsive transcriptional regulator)